MANQVVIPQNFGSVSTKFANVKTENDLAAGVQAGFGLIGYKGKVWSIRYRGEEQQLLRDDGDGPRNSIEVVILKGASYISKIWYEKGYVEGSTAAPDCFSPNGVVPDPQSTKRQSNACANCPQNVWGSKITEAGKKGKACSDSKRLAVVPVGDIPNETFGGPMLLRVPAASLQDLATYGNKMQNLGYPYFAIATRIAFDPNEAYPKFVFSAIRPLTDEEAEQVLALQPTQEVSRVLAEGSEHQQEAAPQAETVENAFEQPPQTPNAAPKPKAQTTAAPKTQQQTTAAPKVAAQTTAAPKASGFGTTSAPKANGAANGTANGTAQTTQKAGGFGATVKTETKPVQQQTTAARKPPQIPDEDEEVQEEMFATDEEGNPVTSEGNEEEGTGSDFEKSLDAQLAELLGTE